jgi:hypothetical protein
MRDTFTISPGLYELSPAIVVTFEMVRTPRSKGRSGLHNPASALHRQTSTPPAPHEPARVAEPTADAARANAGSRQGMGVAR